MFNDVCTVSVRQVRSCRHIRPHIKWFVSMVIVLPLQSSSGVCVWVCIASHTHFVILKGGILQ